MNIEIKEKNKPDSQAVRYFTLALMTLIIVLVIVIRYRLLNVPLERDEGEYAYIGQLMLKGVPPYKSAVNMKLPGIYVVYAIIMTLFGQSPKGIHLGLLFANIAAIILVVALSKRLFGFTAAMVSGAVYGVLSMSSVVYGFAGHATQFVILTALTGIILLLKALENNRAGLLFLSGLILGFAFLIKQPGIFL